ncbi:MAG TPA: SulP family inorganic anion transporter [Reyranella sp.]|nr:SulP family inorganic anion transporter [Reyranella sp.]
MLRNLLAGLTLAAITIPEQMATAKLGGFAPQIGFYAFIGATVGFALVSFAFRGASRLLTAGADSTITPIFAASLAGLAASGGTVSMGAAVTLALLMAGLLVTAGLLKLGWVADLISTPIVTGFLAGIALHIVVSQLPDLLGVPAPPGTLAQQIGALVPALGRANPWSVALALGVLAAVIVTERLNPRIPGALIAVAFATAAVMAFGLEGKGVTALGALPEGGPRLVAPDLSYQSLRELVPLALIVALIVMMQTATVSRAFPGPQGIDVNRDYLGLGVANLGAALLGAFPVNASPPRTAVVKEAGGTSQAGALVAAAVVLALALKGGTLLAHVPQAALAGVLLFVASRIVRVQVIAAVTRQAPGEAVLIALTMAAVDLLPIPTGVAIGIGMSLLHGVWITTRTQVVEFVHVPGGTIWWPPGHHTTGAPLPGVLVAGYSAPLLFANAETFRRGLMALVNRKQDLKLVVLEANGIAEVDYTAAEALCQAIAACHAKGLGFAIARLESARARHSLRQFGVLALLGEDCLFLSVAEAVRSLAPTDREDGPSHGL